MRNNRRVTLKNLRKILLETREPHGRSGDDYQYGLALGYLGGLVDAQAINIFEFTILCDLAENATLKAREARHAA